MPSLFQWLRTVRNKSQPASSAPPRTQSPFSELSVDLVILIMSLLPRADKMSAALTCKSLLFIYSNVLHEPTAPVSGDDKADFLLRLERDLMATHNYCAICSQLHRLASLNKPNENPRYVLFGNAPTCLGVDYRNSPIASNNHFAYHHGRAVMNCHFYGAPAGPDPDLLHYDASTTSSDRQLNKVKWSSRCSVSIISDSLFLFGEHLMDSTDVPSMMTRLDEAMYGICHHTTMEKLPKYITYTKRAAKLDASEISRFLQETGRVVYGSCDRCLTDYTVQITRNYRGPGADVFYRVEVQAYHDFGQFRSPEEWKWRAWRSKIQEGGMVEPRDVRVYPPGIVRQRYQAYHAAKDV